jgi:polysaccharide pyruvyl transferase CsaB
MKILLVADHMNSGGAETHIFELSRLLYQMGHYVTILSYGGQIAEQISNMGVRTVRYGKIPLCTLADVIRNLKPHVVHAHTRQSLFLCQILRRVIKFPLVFTAHAHFSTHAVKKALTLFPRRTIAVSHDIAEHLAKQFGVPKSNIAVIPNGIDTSHFCPIWHKNNGFRIVTISRLDADCSLTAELLCRLAPQLSQEISGLRITIIGGGSDLCKIRHLAELSNKACGYRVINAIGQKQNVLPYLQHCDLFVGVSRAALEAMSCAVPVILSGNEGYLGICQKSVFREAERGNYCARGQRKPNSKILYHDICRLYRDKKSAVKSATDGMLQVRKYHTAEQMAHRTLNIYRAAIDDETKARTSDILLGGYYGYGNLGDELTLLAIADRLKKAPDAYAPPRISVLTRGTETYPSLSAVCRVDLVRCIHAISHTGVFILGGGSLLQNKTSNRSLLYYILLIETAHFFGIPCMLYASGIGPISGNLPWGLCRHALDRVDVITTRDPVSYELVKKATNHKRLLLSSDPVSLYRLQSAPSQKYILAFVRDRQLVPMFHLLCNQHLPIVLAVMDAQSDIMATKKLAVLLKKQSKQVTVICDCTPKAVFSLVRHAAMVISARLHALILAFDMGVPLLGVSDDPKITAFVDMAYAGISLPATRREIALHFRKNQKRLQELAKKDATAALCLARLTTSHTKTIDKPLKK